MFHRRRDQEQVRIDLLREKTGSQILLDHRRGAPELGSLTHDGNSAASAADHDLVQVQQSPDCLDLNDCLRYR